MRALFLLLTVGAFFFLLPARANAQTREGSVPDSFREFRDAKAHAPDSKSPVEQPADWIAVGGIICYAIIPVVIVIALGVVAYRVYVHNTESAILATSRDAWIYRGARPPPGLVVFTFP